MPNDEWRTPEWVWKPYASFDLDAAATAKNTLAPKFITKEMDALTYDWLRLVPDGSHVWLNPPYSQEAGPLMRWVETAMKWHDNGLFATMLLPADTSTKWFHTLWEESKGGFRGPFMSIDFLPRRVRHLDPVTGKPGGSPKFGSLIARFT